MPDEENRCLSSAMLPTDQPVLKRCQLDAPHKWHQWTETSEGHDRVPLSFIWDDRRCVKQVQGKE